MRTRYLVAGVAACAAAVGGSAVGVAGGLDENDGKRGKSRVSLWRPSFPPGTGTVTTPTHRGGALLMDGEVEAVWTVPGATSCIGQFPLPVELRVATVGMTGDPGDPSDDRGLVGEATGLTIDMPVTTPIHLDGFVEGPTALALTGVATCETPTGEFISELPVQFVSARAFVPVYR